MFQCYAMEKHLPFRYINFYGDLPRVDCKFLMLWLGLRFTVSNTVCSLHN